MLDTEGDLWCVLPAEADELMLTALADPGSWGALASAEPLDVAREGSMGYGVLVSIEGDLLSRREGHRGSSNGWEVSWGSKVAGEDWSLVCGREAMLGMCCSIFC